MQTPNRLLRPGEFIGEMSRREAQACASMCLIAEQKHIEPHEHSDCHFVYLIAGAYETSARGSNGLAGPKAAIFNGPGVRHRDQFVSAGTLMTFTPTISFLEKTRAPEPAQEQTYLLAQDATAHIFNRILNEFMEGDPLSAFVLEGLTLELMAIAARTCDNQSTTPPSWLATARARLDDAASNETGSDDAPTISSLAHEIGVHPVYLARAFRRFLGTSPGDYLRRAKARRAAAMMINSNAPLAEIALAHGFSDQAAFTKAFRRAAGATPAAFRRKWLN